MLQRLGRDVGEGVGEAREKRGRNDRASGRGVAVCSHEALRRKDHRVRRERKAKQQRAHRGDADRQHRGSPETQMLLLLPRRRLFHDHRLIVERQGYSIPLVIFRLSAWGAAFASARHRFRHRDRRSGFPSLSKHSPTSAGPSAAKVLSRRNVVLIRRPLMKGRAQQEQQANSCHTRH